MSTRCQVKVIQEGLGWQEAVTLYHHCDGYPTNMLPLIQQAFLLGCQPMKLGKDMTVSRKWELGRAGKAASFLCAADPGSFEPEDSHELHGDIEWYYIVHIVNKERGGVNEEPHWNVEVCDVPWEGKPKSLRTVEDIGGMPKARLKKLAEKLEDPEEDEA